jgi:hypothetical protein
MKGFVRTPPAVVDRMVGKLFGDAPPRSGETLLDPGCGSGAFIEGVIRWCREHDRTPPRIHGVEPHPARCDEAREQFAQSDFVEIEQKDFLEDSLPSFDYVMGNPPYVPITQLSEGEKTRYRNRFATAHGRFDLYLLFFERAAELLKADGRLVYVTPEKYLTVQTAAPLRRLLGRHCVREVELLAEDTFSDLVTYPAVTTLDKSAPDGPATLHLRDGTQKDVHFSESGASLAPQMYDGDGALRQIEPPVAILQQFCRRISAGVATGADRIFVTEADALDEALEPFAHPAVAGRQLAPSQPRPQSDDALLVPYDETGALLPPDSLGALGEYLSVPEREQKLLGRSCVPRKPWYAFHETPPMDAFTRPKILCKDIAPEPHFWADREGHFIPRHSVYYIVPHDARDLDLLEAHLNSDAVAAWLKANCQRAANDYLRLQSTPLKRIPIPETLAEELHGRSARGDESRASSLAKAPTLFQ